MRSVEVGKAKDIREGELKLAEIAAGRVLVANVAGQYYAFDDRCPHMNAPLHMGFLKGNILTCPLHFSTFDVTTGKKLSDPRIGMPPEMMKKFPEDLRLMFSRMEGIMAQVKTYDLKTYKVKVDQDRIFVEVE